MLLSEYLERYEDPCSGMTQAQRLQVLLDTENLLRSHLHGALQVPEEALPGVKTQDGEAMLPAPYDRLYVYALEAAVCYALGEMTRHNNAMALYSQLLAHLDLAVMRHWAPVPGPDLRLV